MRFGTMWLLGTLFLACDTEFLACDSKFLACDSKFLACDTKFLACDTEFLACDSKFLACDSKFLACDTKFLACDTKFLACDTKFLACDTKFLACDTQFLACWLTFLSRRTISGSCSGAFTALWMPLKVPVSPAIRRGIGRNRRRNVGGEGCIGGLIWTALQSKNQKQRGIEPDNEPNDPFHLALLLGNPIGFNVVHDLRTQA
ncbi:MAG: hypothetical protein AB1813_17600 [Verrucomicrobiota bacterium]